jgi:sulfite reductase (ferredoxin)
LHQALGRKVGYRCAAADTPDAIERLMTQYHAHRAAGENLRSFFARHTNEELKAFLSEPTA